MLDQTNYERRLAHDLATMLIETHVDAKRVLAFMQDWTNAAVSAGRVFQPCPPTGQLDWPLFSNRTDGTTRVLERFCERR